VQEQIGIIRVNCLDCLDRTNVVQASYCFNAFQIQMQALKDMGELEVSE